MIRAAIFDLDGTLANTLESMSSVGNEIVKELGLKEQPIDNYRYYCGEGADMLVQRLLKDAGDEKLAYYEKARQTYRERFARDPLYRVVPYDGVTETLTALRRCGLKLGVCSNKPHEAAVDVIKKMFDGYFDIVIGQSDEIRRKPAPDAPLKAASEFGVFPDECLYIGDTGTDMLTGTRAGMRTIGALWGFRDEKELIENGAEILAKNPTEILTIYKEWNHD